MRPDRATALVVRWVRLYTAGLPRPVAHRRIEEIQADLHDEVVYQRSHGVSDRRIGNGIASRMIRGAAADVAWRAHEVRTARARSTEENPMETVSLTRSALRVSVVVLAVLAIPLVGMTVSGDVDWSITDFVLAGTLLGVIGICIETAIRRRGNVLIAGAVACLGVAAGVVGELDDAPGLVLIGGLMIMGGGAVAYRRIQGAH